MTTATRWQANSRFGFAEVGIMMIPLVTNDATPRTTVCGVHWQLHTNLKLLVSVSSLRGCQCP